MRRRIVLLLVLLAALVVACAESATLSWRNVTLDVPDGWFVIEEGESHLSLANADIGWVAGEGEVDWPDEPVVAMFFTFEPHALPDDWRRYVAEQDATLEADDQIHVGGGEVPATRMVFSYTTGGVDTREMVVVIPSRHIVVLAQPVPSPGATDAPEVFLEHIGTFLDVLEDAEFGSPVLD